MVKAYPAIFHKDENSYWVEFPDLSGCVTEGDTIAGAASEAMSALGAYLCSMMDRGLEIPSPSRIQDLTATSEDFVSIVAADPVAFQKRTCAVKKNAYDPRMAQR